MCQVPSKHVSNYRHARGAHAFKPGKASDPHFPPGLELHPALPATAVAPPLPVRCTLTHMDFRRATALAKACLLPAASSRWGARPRGAWLRRTAHPCGPGSLRRAAQAFTELKPSAAGSLRSVVRGPGVDTSGVLHSGTCAHACPYGGTALPYPVRHPSVHCCSRAAQRERVAPRALWVCVFVLDPKSEHSHGTSHLAQAVHR